MLRHSVFAIVLVGAAFAGGAVMNGTGLAWFKALAAGGPRIVVDGGPTPATPPASAAAAESPFPAAPNDLPDLGVTPVASDDDPDSPPAAKGDPDEPAEPARRRAPDRPRPDLAAKGEPDAPTVTIPARRPDAPAPAVEPPSAPTVAATEPPELAAPPAIDPGPAPADPPSAAKSDPVARLASTRDGDAQAEPPAITPEPAPSPEPAPPNGPARDWGEMRRKIRAAGIVRYEIEAEVEGRVRFTCVIPVDGLRAVGHQFEAEGDDEFQAAEAALRRVALWRATESK